MRQRAAGRSGSEVRASVGSKERAPGSDARMVVAPAVDLRGGRCVQLVGGDPGREAVSIPDPAAVVAGWRERDFGTLHIVDLDAALGEPSDNARIIRSLLGVPGVFFQVGGGLRRRAQVSEVLDAGAARAIVGTRAVTERAWLESLAKAHPDRLMVAVDAREGRILTHGWRREAGWELVPYLSSLTELPLAGVLYTDVGREGRMKGIDRTLAREVLAAAHCPVWVSGGIASLADLEFLDEAGAGGAVLGMSVYTGELDAGTLARRWGGGGSDPRSGAAR